jgi:hypothetical protein
MQKSKKDLPHSAASVPLISKRLLSVKIAQTLSTVAAMLLLWKGALEIHLTWLKCS